VTDALALHDVDAVYGDSHVLHGIGLTLRERSLLALLGRNGAGKTTCMGAIMGMVRVRRGSVALFGQPITGFASERIARLGVGLAPQGRRLFPSLTVAENLMVAHHARPGAAWSIERVFATFPRLAERRAQFAVSLSGGEQQMLAIGRALMGNPRVLLLDEPSEGLAPQIVHEIGRIIAGLKADGLSIILVEQNVRLALGLADEVAVINTGRLELQAPAALVATDDALLERHLGVF
jgi:branched-chain amino acid transport system ATP-binding protein